MRPYGEAAVIAARQCLANRETSPPMAWTAAVREVFPNSESQRNKGCPRGAFLGLCEDGYVKGVPEADYTRSTKNKNYALCAAMLLRVDERLADDPDLLWERVVGHDGIAHNEQMEVVIALWRARLLVDS